MLALAALGLCLALGGAASREMARQGVGKQLVAARALLPLVDLVAAGGALWLFDGSVALLTLFVIPAALAALLLGWRVGAAAAALSMALAVAVEIALAGALPRDWLVGALAVLVTQGLVVAACGVAIGRTRRAYAELSARYSASQHAREDDHAERTRLFEGLRLLEETHFRLEQERSQIDRQTIELAHIVRRIVVGDLRVAYELLKQVGAGSGLAGHPLGELVSGLAQWIRQEHATPQARARQARQRQQAEQLSGALAEQTQLLRATDSALREQAAVANQLVAEIQWLAHEGSRLAGTLPGTQSPAGRRLHQLEQMALGHASSTAMLGARTAQLRMGQDQLAARVRDLAGVSDPLAGSGGPAAVSGAFTPETVVAVGGRARGQVNADA